MGRSRFDARSFVSALLGASALTALQPAADALAVCAPSSQTPTLITIGCTGDTSIATLPVPAVPISAQIFLGADGSRANVNLTQDLTINLTGGAGTYFGLDTLNAGAPSSITGVGNGLNILSSNGADILIGQNSLGGVGINADITGLNGAGIRADALGSGSIAITTAPGATVTGTNAQAIFATSVNGNITINVNGYARVLPSFANQYSVQAVSTGAGNIFLGGSGVFMGGVAAESSGTGSIVIGGSGTTTFEEGGVVTNGVIRAVISNAASDGSITINRSGALIGGDNQNGIYAQNLGAGSISIAGIGDVIAGTTAIEADARGGNITIAPAGFVRGGEGIRASATGAGDIDITTVGDVTGTNGFGIISSVVNGRATINVGALSTISGASGPLSLTGATVVNNAGTLSFVDGATGLTTWSGATLNGQGGALAIDLNAGAGVADRLAVSRLSGTTSIRVTNVGSGGLLSSPVPILTATTVDPGASVTAAHIPGIIDYEVSQAGNVFSLSSSINTSVASATPTGIDAVLTALNTGFFQNASAFVSEPTNPERNQWNGGPWIRIANGRNDVSATTTAYNASGADSAPSKVRADFDGFQTGLDLGLANIEGSGWNTHLGVTAGMVNLRTNNLLASNISSAVQVPFMGLYAAVTGHNFFADVQIREDFFNLSLNNSAANLYGAGLDGTAFAFNASAGYRFDLPSAWFVEPSLAFMYSRLSMHDLLIPLESGGGSLGTLDFNPFVSELGRAGVRVGTTQVLEQYQLALQPFATGSVWREFAGATHTDFRTGDSVVPLSVTRIGTFGQVGLGVSGQVLKTGFLGFLRGDYRFGDNIQGYAVVAGMRYQF